MQKSFFCLSFGYYWALFDAKLSLPFIATTVSIVNIGVGEDVTIAELAALIAQTIGFEGRIVYDPSQPDGTPRKLMDVGLLNAAGWRAKTGLAAGLRRAHADFVAQEQRP